MSKRERWQADAAAINAPTVTQRTRVRGSRNTLETFAYRSSRLNAFFYGLGGAGLGFAILGAFSLLLVYKGEVGAWAYLAACLPIGGALLSAAYGGAWLLIDRIDAYEATVRDTEINKPVILPSEARHIPYSIGNDPLAPIVLERESKTLDGVIFRGSWLETIWDNLTSGDHGFSRAKSGIGSGDYPMVKRALMSAEYIDGNSVITETGAAWFSPHR